MTNRPAMTPRAAMDTLRRRKRRRTSLPRDSPASGSSTGGPAWAEGAAAPVGMRPVWSSGGTRPGSTGRVIPGTPPSPGSSDAHPGVEGGVGDIGQEAGQQNQDAGEDGHRGHHVDVVLVDRVD